MVAAAAHDRLKSAISVPALRFASTRARHYMPAMIRISTTAAAFDAIAATLPLGLVAVATRRANASSGSSPPSSTSSATCAAPARAIPTSS
jgi:hypothetical protein